MAASARRAVMEMEEGKGSVDQNPAKRPQTAEDVSGGHESSTILFSQGLPGFPSATRFALKSLSNVPEGLLLLQCVDDPDLRFLVLPYLGSELPLRRCDLDL